MALFRTKSVTYRDRETVHDLKRPLAPIVTNTHETPLTVRAALVRQPSPSFNGRGRHGRGRRRHHRCELRPEPANTRPARRRSAARRPLPRLEPVGRVPCASAHL